jgi:V/A-type H+/Na+-transporting ATPase subunit D
MRQEKIKLTRPELKRQRDILARYQRFLPTLKLKHQLLQQSLLEAERHLQAAETELTTCDREVLAMGTLNELPTGLMLESLSMPIAVSTAERNVAGVKIPVFEQATFPAPEYSAMFTPPYVDELLARQIRSAEARLKREARLRGWQALRREFARVNQRLNLFEKVIIPQTRDAIHRIRIFLGDEQTAAVGRAKLARTKQMKKREKARAASMNTAMIAKVGP